MNLLFNTSLAETYKSASQIARVLTEDWLAHNMYCPICGEITIRQAEPNAPVKDFVCYNCKSQYELKSKKTESDRFQSNVVDGVYRTMIERITSLNNPSFFFLHYNRYEVYNLIIVPKCFFSPNVIEKRKVLSENARRAGWEGCNILMRKIPAIAKIPIILNGEIMPSTDVISQYKRVFNLQTSSMESRGWLIDTLHIVERMEDIFSLKQMYEYCAELKTKHPNNNHIQDKIRQQLQFLRDKGFIEFKGHGIYKKT